MIIDGGLPHYIAKVVDVPGHRLLVLTTDDGRIGHDRFAAFHIEEPRWSFEVKINFALILRHEVWERRISSMT